MKQGSTAIPGYNRVVHALPSSKPSQNEYVPALMHSITYDIA